MALNKKSIKGISIIALLLLTAWLCRFPPFHVSTIPYIGAACGLLRPLIYIDICAAWSVSLSRTIINKRLRIYLQSMAICCILWMFLRTVKFELTFRGDGVNTFLLHVYYIPFILLLTFGFFASLYARRGERYNMPRAVYLSISCVSMAAILFVLTNPFHELYWTHMPEPYSHAAGFPFVMGWAALLLVMTVVNIIVRAKIPGKHEAAMLPIIVLAIIVGYFVLLVFFPNVWEYVSSDWTSFTCLAAIGLMQSCITSGMLPSNSGYAKAFEASDMGMIITDDDWNICYASAGAEILPKSILQKTEAGAFEKDKKTLLKGRKLHPGHAVWKEDISAISAVLEELEQNRKELTAKNELDRENNRTQLALSKAQEKNRLYNLSQAVTSKQNKLLHDTLSRYFKETDADARKALLAEASVLGAYIKRKGNLIFAGDSGTVRASELKLCFNESIGNMALLQNNCHMDFSLPDETELSLNTALCLYDSFETAIETIWPDIVAAFIRIMEDNENLRAIYSLVSSQDLSAVVFPEEASVEQDNDTWIVSLSLPKGGDA